jgi:hypothetical protein
VIQGYVYDNYTGDVVNNTRIEVDWRDNDSHYVHNYTYTDSTGFYMIDVAPGEIEINTYKKDYFNEDIERFIIENNETMILDFQLISRPIEKSVVFGYIYDYNTGHPIDDVSVWIDWEGLGGYEYFNHTSSNSTGYYEFNIASGKIHVDLYLDEYFTKSSEYYNISDNESLQIDFYMHPYPVITSNVFGYIIDVKSSKQIEGANIWVYWEDEFGNIEAYRDTSDSTGFYNLSLPAGSLSMEVKKNGYYRNYSRFHFNISENESKQFNYLLYPIPPVTSNVYGYVIDVSGNPFINNSVHLFWEDEEGHYFHNTTYTDSNGYYSFKTAAGTLRIGAGHFGYFSNYSGYFNISDNVSMCINFTLEEIPLDIEIDFPSNVLIFNNRILSRLLFKTIVIGDVDVLVNPSIHIEYVEFYVDGILKYTDYDYPFEWFWSANYLFRHRHVLKVVGYTDDDFKIADRQYVLRYF